MIYQKKSDGSWTTCAEYMGTEGDQELNGNLSITGGNTIFLGGENQEKYCALTVRRSMFNEKYETGFGIGGLLYKGHAQITLNKIENGATKYQNRFLFGSDCFYPEVGASIGNANYPFNNGYFRSSVFMGNDSTINANSKNEYAILNFKSNDNATRYGYIGKGTSGLNDLQVRALLTDLELSSSGERAVKIGTASNYLYTHFGSKSWRLAPREGITGMTNLGSNEERFKTLYCTTAPNVSSDKSLKENIVYVNSKENLVRDNSILNNDDMYKFVRDDLKLAKYNYINKREDFKEEENDILGFIAQDIKEENKKVADILLQEDKNGLLSYDSATYTNILAGALQKAINKIEKLELEIALLKNN